MSVIITPKAAAQVGQAAAESGEGQPVLRVAAKRDRDGAIDYAMGFDEPREEDTVSLQHGVRLLIAPTSLELLTDTALDSVYIETEVDPPFIFRNPNTPNYQPATYNTGPLANGVWPLYDQPRLPLSEST